MKKQWSVVSGQWSVGVAGKAGGQPAINLSSPAPATDHRLLITDSRGFTLIELVITLLVLTILTMSVIPLVRVSVKRQREQQLREALHQLRNAIDQFHREALAGAQMQPQGTNGGTATGSTGATVGTAGTAGTVGTAGNNVSVDPRVRVAITDTTIFGTDNPDRYPPDLDTLVNGVNVTPLASSMAGATGGGINGVDNDRTATSNSLTSTKKKVYLREIPIDPMTGERNWELRSVYDTKDSGSWSGENVFDVRSKSSGTALNGEKYSDW